MNLQYLLDKYNLKIDINTILTRWNESHRGWHNIGHLNDLIDQINELYFNNKISDMEKDQLTLIALFHDIYYDPINSQNEEISADFFLSTAVEKKDPFIKEIYESIIDTKNHTSKSKISEIFNQMDMNIVERDYESLLKWEKGIYEEYKIFGNEKYKEGRLKFLDKLMDNYPNNTENLLKLADYVKNNY